MEKVLIDVRVLEPRMKHPAIFNAFDALEDGYSVVIHNDHDPKPLYYQLLGERGNCFSWNYLQNGPELWEVEIRKQEKTRETVGEIAAKDLRKAELLKKMGIDFCCGGKKTIEEACQEKGLDVHRVKRELEEVNNALPGIQLDFNAFSPSFLADYIVNVHHAYVNTHLPLIEELAEKVALRHGHASPYLTEIHNKVNELRCELMTHMKKEEQVLFPYIKQLEQNGDRTGSFQSVQYPISVMERDHDIAGALMSDIRRLTHDYKAPESACNSFRMLYQKLEAFENDLHLHIHLENNILFPKAIAMKQD